jgi:hypothetical protein
VRQEAKLVSPELGSIPDIYDVKKYPFDSRLLPQIRMMAREQFGDPFLGVSRAKTPRVGFQEHESRLQRIAFTRCQSLDHGPRKASGYMALACAASPLRDG